jgi:hypothetical protein
LQVFLASPSGSTIFSTHLHSLAFLQHSREVTGSKCTSRVVAKVAGPVGHPSVNLPFESVRMQHEIRWALGRTRTDTKTIENRPLSALIRDLSPRFPDPDFSTLMSRGILGSRKTSDKLVTSLSWGNKPGIMPRQKPLLENNRVPWRVSRGMSSSPRTFLKVFRACDW